MRFPVVNELFSRNAIFPVRHQTQITMKRTAPKAEPTPSIQSRAAAFGSARNHDLVRLSLMLLLGLYHERIIVT
jgi:hypothetical protein